MEHNLAKVGAADLSSASLALKICEINGNEIKAKLKSNIAEKQYIIASKLHQRKKLNYTCFLLNPVMTIIMIPSMIHMIGKKIHLVSLGHFWYYHKRTKTFFHRSWFYKEKRKNLA